MQCYERDVLYASTFEFSMNFCNAYFMDKKLVAFYSTYHTVTKIFGKGNLVNWMDLSFGESLNSQTKPLVE